MRRDGGTSFALRLPANGTAYNLLAYIARVRQDWDEARRILEREVERSPSHGPLQENYASFLMQHGQAEQALVQMHRAVELDPRNSHPLAQLAWFHSITGDDAAAIEAWERALELDPHFVYAPAVLPVSLALAYHRQGDEAAARQALLRALPAGETNAAVRAYDARGVEGLVASRLDDPYNTSRRRPRMPSVRTTDRIRRRRGVPSRTEGDRVVRRFRLREAEAQELDPAVDSDRR